MTDPRDEDSGGEEMERQAAAWVLRSDRGLTPAEQDELVQWLAADERHGRELARFRRHWQRLDQLAGSVSAEEARHPRADLLAPPDRGPAKPFWNWLPLSLAAAAAVLFAFFVFPSFNRNAGHHAAVAGALPDGSQVLEDGSRVEIKDGALLATEYTPHERRVRLTRGEAYFIVAREPRPFVVTASGIDVRALGTAFNVRVDDGVVEVLVTNGQVQVVDAAAEAGEVRAAGRQALPPKPPLVPILEPHQRAVVSIATRASPPQVATLTPGEIDQALAWQHRPLDFTAAPLSDVVAEFNRRNRVQMILGDPELAAIRVSGSFRSDNIDGFLRLLEAGFGAQGERKGENEIYIRTRDSVAPH